MENKYLKSAFQSGTEFDGDPYHDMIFSPVCNGCKHLLPGMYLCEAFLDGIPPEIWIGKTDHSKPYPGDRGIRFEKGRDT